MTDHNLDAIKAALIRKVLPHHVAGFLPGKDHSIETSRWVSGSGGGTLNGDNVDRCWYATHTKGVGVYDDLAESQDPNKALVFIKWREFIDIARHGAKPDLVAELERAQEAWAEYHRNQPPSWQADPLRGLSKAEKQAAIDKRFEEWRAVDRPYSDARRAIVEAGIEGLQVEMTLF